MVLPICNNWWLLVDNSSPVGQLEVRHEEPAQVVEGNAARLGRLERLDNLLTQPAVIEFIHAEDNPALARKRGSDFLAVHYPEGTGHSLLDEVGRMAEFAFAHQPIALGKTARSGHRFKLEPGLLRKRTEGVDGIDEIHGGCRRLGVFRVFDDKNTEIGRECKTLHDTSAAPNRSKSQIQPFRPAIAA